MYEVMNIVLRLSLSGTLLTGILFLFRPLYKERLSRRWQYYIWLVVIARLLVPWTPERSPFGAVFQTAEQKAVQAAYQFMDQNAGYLKNIGQSADLGWKSEKTPVQDSKVESLQSAGSVNETIEDDEMVEGNKTIEGSKTIKDNEKTAGSETVKTNENAGSTESEQAEAKGSSVFETAKYTAAKMPAMVIKYLPVIWLVTAMLLLLRKLTVYQSFYKYIRAGSSAVDDIQLLEQAGALIEQNRLNRRKAAVEVCTNSLISSPLLIGILKPCIVLPASDYFLSETGFHYTVLHELNHYRRGDLIYKWLVQVTVCLHWFNPFVYLMERAVSRECELSCDEAVIRKMDEQVRKEYGSTLLNAVTAGTYSSPGVSAGFNEGRELLKGRLDAIMNYKQKSKAAAMAAVALACLFAAGAASIGIHRTPAAVTGSEAKGAGALDADELPILCEDGSSYYIFAPDAQASDKPSSSVTDGMVGLDYISMDGYCTIGPFGSRKKFLKEVKSQCSYDMKHGTGTQEEYDVFLSAAQEIDRISRTDSDKFPKLNKHSITVAEGGTASLKMIRVRKKPVWSSGSDQIAAVDQKGKVTAKKAGKTKIYAKIGRITYVCKVKVKTQESSKRAYAKAYAEYGIAQENDSYYYKGRRIRIFMDVKADESFFVFNYDRNGTIDLRLRRAEDGSIIKIENPAPEEIDEIRDDLELTDLAETGNTKQDLTKVYSNKEGTGSYAKIVRMTKKEVPKKVRKALQACSRRQWYVISRNKTQYIYYAGLPVNYAFHTEMDEDSLKVGILDLGRTSAGYVLLAIEQNQNTPMTLSYNGRQVSYEKQIV